MRYIVRSLMLLRVTEVAFHMRNIDVMLTCRDAHILKTVEVEVYLHEVIPHRCCLIDCLMLEFLASSWGHDERKQPVNVAPGGLHGFSFQLPFSFHISSEINLIGKLSKFMSSC